MSYRTAIQIATQMLLEGFGNLYEIMGRKYGRIDMG